MDLTEYKHQVIDAASAGDNTVVRAIPGKRIVVTALYLVSTSANTLQFRTGTTGNDLTGGMALAANGVLQAGYHPDGHFATVAGDLLNLRLSGGTSVDGWLTYRVVA